MKPKKLQKEKNNVGQHKRSNKKLIQKIKIVQITSKILHAPPAFVAALKQQTLFPSTTVVPATETNVGSPNHEL